MIGHNKIVKHLSQTPIYRIFIKDICKYPVLSDEEMADCLVAVHSDNPEVKQKAIDRIINHNQLFIVMVARKWATDDNLMDLISEGNLGLMRAIELYDSSLGVKFLSYAVNWVESAIRQYINRTQPIVTPPAIHRRKVRINKVVDKFIQENQRMPSVDEVKDIIGGDIHNRLDSFTDLSDCSLVALNDNMGNNPLSADCLTNKSDWEFFMTRAFGVLNDREKRIIDMTFGIGEYKEPLTTVETGKLLGLSSERVRQIKVRALDKMKEGISQYGGLVDVSM